MVLGGTAKGHWAGKQRGSNWKYWGPGEKKGGVLRINDKKSKSPESFRWRAIKRNGKKFGGGRERCTTKLMEQNLDWKTPELQRGYILGGRISGECQEIDI